MRRSVPNCHIIAGPNGAGKTTFATEFLPFYANCRNFINADLIARGLSALYRPLLDTLHLFDNSSAVPRLIFKDESGQTTIRDAALYGELRRQFEP